MNVPDLFHSSLQHSSLPLPHCSLLSGCCLTEIIVRKKSYFFTLNVMGRRFEDWLYKKLWALSQIWSTVFPMDLGSIPPDVPSYGRGLNASLAVTPKLWVHHQALISWILTVYVARHQVKPECFVLYVTSQHNRVKGSKSLITAVLKEKKALQTNSFELCPPLAAPRGRPLKRRGNQLWQNDKLLRFLALTINSPNCVGAPNPQ